MKTYRHKDLGLFTVTVPHYHWVEDNNGGGRRVNDPSTVENVRLLIDVDAIISRLGVRACQSKSRKAKYLAGAIIVARV